MYDPEKQPISSVFPSIQFPDSLTKAYWLESKHQGASVASSVNRLKHLRG
tara:strand:- start:1935 stop:2084 length:150 start_codon:yes stop_codon:yes gene_type:complete